VIIDYLYCLCYNSIVLLSEKDNRVST
jgi:hypothetical protein